MRFLSKQCNCIAMLYVKSADIWSLVAFVLFTSSDHVHSQASLASWTFYWEVVEPPVISWLQICQPEPNPPECHHTVYANAGLK